MTHRQQTLGYKLEPPSYVYRKRIRLRIDKALLPLLPDTARGSSKSGLIENGAHITTREWGKKRIKIGWERTWNVFVDATEIGDESSQVALQEIVPSTIISHRWRYSLCCFLAIDTRSYVVSNERIVCERVGSSFMLRQIASLIDLARLFHQLGLSSIVLKVRGKQRSTRL